MKKDLRLNFTNHTDFESYIDTIWQDPEIDALYQHVNDRFEMLLRNGVNIRHDIRTGIRQTDEKITITIYEWIRRFMERTHRIEVLAGVTIGPEKGRVELHLYNRTAEFIPE